jgi:hypothetical protein
VRVEAWFAIGPARMHVVYDGGEEFEEADDGTVPGGGDEHWQRRCGDGYELVHGLAFGGRRASTIRNRWLASMMIASPEGFSTVPTR